ncbi:hypothetical protein ASF17_12630 [Frigoribacterium sp. Leaf263]|uniref:DUF2332 family protein n=1 Tax=Frigoribacterium sp. Leaf263 TaxID=1736313 RepID=UPI0006FCF047|nr:DUF2332 family protein [Frigoribacterium sp. Leaf263]KQO81926.1 hypothetical protein ASF17_12630 [Frigoribacterium sp. Leaf263]
MLLADRFRAHAEAAVRERSPLYDEWSRGIADDPDVLALIGRAPEARRQPALVLAVARWLGAPLEPWPSLREWMLAHPDALVAELGRRTTQVNDVRRLGPVSLALSRVDGPVALLEVGASAGLCLFPDRYAFHATARGHGVDVDLRWGDPVGDVVVGLDIDLGSGADAPPSALAGAVSAGRVELPEIVWRAGLDLDPVDVTDPSAVSWLETSLPPGPSDRVDLLRRAVAVARSAPPRILRADAVDGLAAAAADAPTDARLVVVSTGTLVYLPGARRQAFVDAVRRLDASWISYERRDLLHDVVVPPHAGLAPGGDFAALALDGHALAVGDAHGTRVRLLPS